MICSNWGTTSSILSGFFSCLRSSWCYMINLKWKILWIFKDTDSLLLPLSRFPTIVLSFLSEAERWRIPEETDKFPDAAFSTLSSVVGEEDTDEISVRLPRRRPKISAFSNNYWLKKVTLIRRCCIAYVTILTIFSRTLLLLLNTCLFLIHFKVNILWYIIRKKFQLFF